VIENVRDAVITADGNGDILGWNKGARDTFGYEEAEVVGQPLTLIVPERYRASHLEAFVRAVRAGAGTITGRTMDLWGLRRDGTEFPCEISVNAWRAGDGVRFNAFLRDITERRQAASAMLMHSRVLESMKEAVVVVDEGAIIRFANAALERTFGYEPGELLGQPIDILEAVSPDEIAARKQAIFASLAATGVWAGDCPNRRKDGTTFTSEISITTVTVDGRKLFVTVQEDVTERRRLQSKLLLSDRMASLGTLAAGVAHEVNNPLSTILANVDLAIEEVAETSAGLGLDRLRRLNGLLVTAKEGSERVRRIVAQMKTFSSATDEDPVALSLPPVLDWAITLTANEIRHRAKVTRDYGVCPVVLANEARLGQVFVNLLVNAAHAISEGHADRNEIRVVTGRQGGSAVVEIHDTGAGMSPEQIHRVFDPFFTTKPIGQGTGLGLSICHRIIGDLGGEISVTSTPGRGSVFRVLLPAAPDPRIDSGKAPSLPLSGARRGRVLVIDDDAAVGLTVERVLRAHDTHVVQSGRDGLALLAAGNPFDVVLCDLMMPEMSGMEFYEELERSAPAYVMRVIFLTGGAFTPAAREFLDRVPNERVDKPFEAKALRALVARFIGDDTARRSS